MKKITNTSTDRKMFLHHGILMPGQSAEVSNDQANICESISWIEVENGPEPKKKPRTGTKSKAKK